MEGQATETSEAATDTSTGETSEATTTAAETGESAGEGTTLATGADLGGGDSTGDVATDETGKGDGASDAAESDKAVADTKPDATADTKPDGDKETDPATDTDDPKPNDNLDGLPEDFDWRSLATDEKSVNRLKHFESMDDLAEFVREADTWRRRAVLVPNSKSTPEEIAKYQKAIGVPDTPDGYDLDVSKDAPADEKELVDRLRSAAHAVNVTPAQLGAMIEWHKAETAAVEAREQENAADQLSQAKAELSRTWGPDYQKNAGVAQKAMGRGFEGFAEDWAGLELKDGTKIGNHPLTLKGFARLGRLFGEAGVPGQVAPDNWAPTKTELLKMQQEPGYIDGTDKDLIKRVTEGYKRLP